MLGFRSLLRTHDTPELLDVASTNLLRWLEHKRYDPAALTVGPPAQIGTDVWGSVQHHTDEAGSRTMRARIVENSRYGAWTSELTVHNSPTGNRGWVWLDIHKPDDHGWTATPRLARQLVRALPARDGAHLLNPHPVVIQEPHVGRVVAALTDPGRRGLAFVAGTDHTEDIASWRDSVEGLLDDTEGLANAWVLSPGATERFNYLVQRPHEVRPGFVRTYVPGVVIGNGLDAERHRYLTKRGIEQDPSRALRRVFGQRAREQMIEARLPNFLRDLDRILRRELDSELLEELTAPAPAPPPRPVERPRPVPPTAAPLEPLPGPVTLEGYLAVMLRGLTGSDELTVENLARVEAMARSAQRAETMRTRISARLEQLRGGVEEAQFERDLAREDLAIEQLERAAAEEERSDAERRLRHVQKELAVLGRADVAWSEADLDVRDIRPDTFVDLLDRFAELDHVVFTGDEDTALDLDKHGNARSWAGKVWDALLALDDYARVSLTEAYMRDVTGYLADTPAGCRGFSANRHASTESEDVHRNPKLRRPRELPVPPEIEESGRCFMGAHFKIAQSSKISPRLHYLDATARTRAIYVGYIGPHLPLSGS